ncbi:MAG TPA: NAD(P)/FAD-dependent oxidoreductase [Gaiellaceae bacterium]|nr:NAD(P)/FAD-dependent oxidoreductase [Gaiellaceae bacterium]
MASGGTTLVLGGGPAGLTAGYLLAKLGRPVLVLEADDQVGGLSRTIVRDGYRFDLGGHRFFTKSPEVESLWLEVLGEELLLRPRLSRIYWNGRFLDYPLSAGDVVRKLGPVELARCVASYLAAVPRRKGREQSLEEWVSNRFGTRLYDLFFRTYTEKVWGVPGSEIRAEWAAQRIKGLSLCAAAKDALLGGRNGSVKSLIREFHYPRYGPGQMWEAMAERIGELGGEVVTGAPADRIHLEDGRIAAVEAAGETIACRHAISSLPLGALAEMVRPAPPPRALAAARGLAYRDFLTVALVLPGADLFPDNWVYVHDPSVRVGRIQNYRSWSPWMVPEADRTCIGLEYFCFEGDDLWETPDERLVELAAAELTRLGLADGGRVERGFVVRVPKAYPVYDDGYAERLATVRRWLDGIAGLQQVGRNGLHRYNNSDHSMLTAIRAVDNLVAGSRHDLWAVNADSVYHEEHARDEHPYARAPEPPAVSATGG